MNDFQEVVRRKRKRWVTFTLIVFAVLAAIFIGFASLLGHYVLGTSNLWTMPLLTLCVWMLICMAISFAAGQIVRGIVTQSWDSWVAQMGPISIRVLIAELETLLQREERNGTKRN